MMTLLTASSCPSNALCQEDYMPKLLPVITVLVLGGLFRAGGADAALRMGNMTVMASNADLSRQHEPRSLPPKAYPDARAFLR
jgi:hypothetical protein